MNIFVFVCFFVSGFASLVFEIVWERSLVTIFGGTSLAISTLLTAFMFGLALGAYIGGRLATRVENPLHTYGAIEVAIGLFALSAPSVFSSLPSVYAPWYALTHDFPFIFNLGRFAVAFFVLAIPTVLMGATLPLLSQYVSNSGTKFRAQIGGLYAINTVGACLGCFLAGFAFLPSLGIWTTNALFAGVDIALGCGVLLVATLSRTPKPIEPDRDIAPETAAVPDRVLLIATACSGFVAMALQILWTRAYVIVLGSSTYSFSLVLTSFLLGLGSGSAVGSMLVARGAKPLRILAWSQAGLVLTAAIATGVIDVLPTLLFERNRETIGSANEIYLFQFGLVAMLVFIPLFLQGMLFPMVVATVARDRDHAGEASSRVYTFNTIGAICGSFLTGFVLLPLLGLQTAFRVALVLSMLVALTFLFSAGGAKTVRLIRAAVVAVVLFAAIGFGTSIDRTELTRGMFRTVWARELFDPKKFLRDRPELLFSADGANATITVEKRGELVTLKSNGKPEASSGADMATQILVAQIPMIVRTEIFGRHGDEDVAMIGYGSGVTAGAALQWPLKSLVVAEIEPEMIGASRFFDAVNHRPIDDPRTEVVAADGRNFLALDDRKWDVIVSEPSNPWIAGVASLFTTEHFELVKSRLKPGGTFAQWVQLYEIHPDNVRDIIKTFSSVFPNVVAFSSMPKGTDLILVAALEPIVFTDAFGERVWKEERTRKELERAGIKDAIDLLGLLFWNQKELKEFSEGGVFNTDDNLRLEFNAPRDLVRYDIGRQYFSDRYFSNPMYGDPRPHIEPSVKTWSVENRANLARAIWRGGKRVFSEQLVGEWGFETEPLGRDLFVAHHAASLDLHEAAIRAWPVPESSWHQLLVQAQTPDARVRVMAYLEQEGVPKTGGFEGEKGLCYAYILWSQKYYKHALKQLRVLHDDPVIAETLFYKLLYGHVAEKRRRYDPSLASFIEAGEMLSQ